MTKSQTTLQHTCPTEAPFDCITGDLTGEGFLVVVDKRTHELVVRYGAAEGTITVLVNPKGVQVKGVNTRPGTRLLDLDASALDPLRQARESLKQFYRQRRGKALYAFTLHPDGSGMLTVCDGDEVASVELSDPMIEQLIELLRSRDRGSNPQVLPEGEEK